MTRARVYKSVGARVERGCARVGTGRLAVGMLAVLLGGVLAGCGSGASDGPSARELALERTQFVQVSSGLASAQPAIQAEVASSREIWPQIASGLPPVPGPALRGAVARVSAKAAAVGVPAFLTEPRSLTGPAAGVAGLYESYERLVPRSWRLVSAALDTIATGPASSAAAYARTNSSFYIDAIYDGHFNLSLVGKSLLTGYEKLGGPSAFGARLPSAHLAALAAAYSIPAVRLEPHPAGAAKEG